MNRYKMFGLVVVAAHWVTAVWHLFLAAKVLPAPATPAESLSLLAIVITLVHLVIAGVWWKLPDRTAGGVVSAFFIAVFALDIYEHFLYPGGNNVFMVLPGEWKTIFDVSVGLLLALEILGAALGVRLLTRKRPVDSLRVAA